MHSAQGFMFWEGATGREMSIGRLSWLFHIFLEIVSTHRFACKAFCFGLVMGVNFPGRVFGVAIQLRNVFHCHGFVL